MAPTSYLPSVAEDLALPVASGTIGMMMDGLRRAVTERDAEQARAATLAERDRLSRIVHDGTLQVLALVEREGRDLGPEGVRLAQLASAQEATLRRLLQDRTVDLRAPTAAPIEITALLEGHQGATVTVSSTTGEIVMDASASPRARPAVQELIVNVAKHAGPGAHAWLLVEQDGDEVVVWFRDDGVGMSEERGAARPGVRPHGHQRFGHRSAGGPRRLGTGDLARRSGRRMGAARAAVTRARRRCAGGSMRGQGVGHNEGHRSRDGHGRRPGHD